MMKRFWRAKNSKKESKENDEKLDKRQKKVDAITSDEIDDVLNKLSAQNMKTISLLLLGPGGSGKSTVLKQMEKIYRGSVQSKILKNAAQYIRQNILEDIYDLCSQNAILKAKYPECALTSEQSQQVCTFIASLKGGHLEETELTPDLAAKIQHLWQDEGLQHTYSIRKRSHIMDNAPYFFANISRISNQNYTTTFEDFVRVRHRTTGIIESEFEVDLDKDKDEKRSAKNTWRFRVTDVGGQRAERKKWLKCFTDIHAVIYVMSLAAYDQTLFEDHTQNCYREALDVFAKTMDNEALATVDVIVFLNKNDIFVPKIQEVPFSIFEPKFDPAEVHNPNAVKEYLRNQFKQRFYRGTSVEKSPRRIHFHVTCATDTNQIQTVMHLIQFETVRKMMRIGMLM